MKKKYLNGLKDSDFLHPTDAKALSVLKSAKGLDVVINWLFKWSYEKVQRILHMGNAIRVTSASYNRLHEMIKLCGDILNMPYPELYVSQNAHVNAYTIGTTSPFMVLSTSIIEALEDEELLAVIAHEMGHIKAKHILYKQVANVLSRHTNWLGPLKVVLDYTLLLSIANWNRKSELTADRASLLVAQDIDTVVSVLMKISGGSRKLRDE
ncbi:M48 family metallopeptidase, partial [bacterium]|nr:M48 family metallopeptidase [bacterium]